MKTTIDIPVDELSDAMRFTGAKTKREAVVTALADFNRRRRMADLIRYAGTCPDLMTVDTLQAQRRQRVRIPRATGVFTTELGDGLSPKSTD